MKWYSKWTEEISVLLRLFRNTLHNKTLGIVKCNEMEYGYFQLLMLKNASEYEIGVILYI